MKFTSIKQIPKEAIEMIDEVQWYEGIYDWRIDGIVTITLGERLPSERLISICNYLMPDGSFQGIYAYYIEPRELEDKTYGINLYKKIHGEK